MARAEGAERLDGWKAVAAFFGRDERTVKRWEATRGLPVHRMPGGGRAAVWADPEELRRWMAGTGAGEAGGAPREEAPSGRSRRWLIAGGVGLAVAAAGGGAAWRLGRQRAPSPQPYDDDPDTQALYLRAVLAWDSRTPEGLASALRDLEEVIRRRPERAEGYAKLADCYLLLREFGSMPQGEAYDRAEAAAQAALKRDPDAAGALRALAFIRFWWRADPKALDLFRRALDLDPTSVQSRLWYANALGARGRHREALAQIQAARRLQPTDVSLSVSEASARADVGDVAGARRDLAQLAALYPDSIPVHRSLASVALQAGDPAAYLEEEEIEAGLRKDAGRLAALKPVRAAFERRGAQAMFVALADAEAKARMSSRGSAVMTAYYWAMAGNAAEARRWLATARHYREPDLIYLPALHALAQVEAS